MLSILSNAAVWQINAFKIVQSVSKWCARSQSQSGRAMAHRQLLITRSGVEGVRNVTIKCCCCGLPLGQLVVAVAQTNNRTPSCYCQVQRQFCGGHFIPYTRRTQLGYATVAGLFVIPVGIYFSLAYRVLCRVYISQAC